MIISASRRTDIPGFYSKWMINRFRAGYCCVPNPFNRNQVSYISLNPNDLDAVVFWTRNPKPLMKYLPELDDLGINYYFQYSILDYPRELDPKSPSLNAAQRTFKELSDLIGADRVIWRYDPIVFTKSTDTEYHIDKFSEIASELRNHTNRAVISIVDDYRKSRGRMNNLPTPEFELSTEGSIETLAPILAKTLSSICLSHDLEIESCSETIDLSTVGVPAGKCIDDELINRLFSNTLKRRKDKNQREQCGCNESRDIGMYDSCVFGCAYCYATQSFEKAASNLSEHDPNSPSLLGNCSCEPPKQKTLF